MAGRHAAMMLAAAVWAALVVVPSHAETVPLPTPAPQPKTGAAPTPPAAVPNAAAPAAADAAPSRPGFFPFSSLFNKDKPQTTTAVIHCQGSGQQQEWGVNYEESER